MVDDTFCQLDLWQLSPYIDAAKKEGVLFGEEMNYYGIYRNGKLAGFCGIKRYGISAVLKCDYVFPENRRQGILKAMIDFRTNKIRNKGIIRVTANCTPLALNVYLRSGAVIIKKFKNGCVKVGYFL